MRLFDYVGRLGRRKLLLGRVGRLLPSVLHAGTLLGTEGSSTPGTTTSVGRITSPRSPALSICATSGLSLSICRPLLRRSLQGVLLRGGRVLRKSLNGSMSRGMAGRVSFLLRTGRHLRRSHCQGLSRLLHRRRTLQGRTSGSNTKRCLQGLFNRAAWGSGSDRRF